MSKKNWSIVACIVMMLACCMQLNAQNKDIDKGKETLAKALEQKDAAKRNEMVQKGEMMSVIDIQEMLGLPLLGVIPEDKRVIISTNKGEPVVMGNDLPLSPEKIGVLLAGRGFEFATQRLVNNDNGTNMPFSDQESLDTTQGQQTIGSTVWSKVTKFWEASS